MYLPLKGESAKKDFWYVDGKHDLCEQIKFFTFLKNCFLWLTIQKMADSPLDLQVRFEKMASIPYSQYCL